MAPLKTAAKSDETVSRASGAAVIIQVWAVTETPP
jgi:hypothetical protein